jgi:hypothetical protein
MSLEEYAKATTASFGRGEMDYYADCPVGKVCETKTEVIPFRGSAYNAKQKAKAIALMSKFETDGWRGDQSDLFNHHRWTRDGGVSVGFTRFVKKTTNLHP